MAERLFSAEAQEKLMQNKNVIKVSETSITYSVDFKIEAVRANVVGGKPPSLIFLDAGFDLEMIGRDNPKRCLRRWRPVLEKLGEEGLRNDQRGKNSTGRPTERELTIEEKLRRAEAKVRYLEKENELLKKFDGIERSVDDRPSKKYRLIHSLIEAKQQGFNVVYLCEVAGVSCSGYYKWLSGALKRAQSHMKDELDLTNCSSIDQVRRVLDDYIYNYNHNRYQWTRKKMAPVEYRNHLLAA
ncbi:MAG: IS3 family transposase [Peptococcaceae bacterium]|nr:IS3 family transposase [Peptococcaceae bacterium]